MTTNFFRMGSSFLKLGRWALVVSLLYYSGYSWAVTLHAIIVADTLDPELNAKMDRDNIQTLLQNVSQATGLTLAVKVIEEHDIEPHGGGREKVMTAVEGISVVPSEDVIVFYYAGHGVNTTPSGEVGGSRWPALEVEGLNTPDQQLVQFSLVKKMLQDKNPRFLMAIADTCNEFDLSRGRGEKILGRLEPGTEEAYQKLFLHKGSVVASGVVPGVDASGDKNGGYFTQAFLNSLKQELKSANPDWTNLMIKAGQLTQEYRRKQIPQAEVDGKLMTAADVGGNGESVGSDTILVGNQSGSPVIVPPIGQSGNSPVATDNSQLFQPQVFCPETASSVGSCYWKDDADKQWNVFVEDKLWFNRWHGWFENPGLLSGSTGHYTAATSREEMVHLITLGARYEKISARLTVSPEHSYGFPKVTDSFIYYGQVREFHGQVSEFQSDDLGKREEMDISVGYSILPELQIGLGFKKMTQAYYTVEGKVFTVKESPNLLLETVKDHKYADYKLYGPTLNIGAQICLANLTGTDISLFGNFSYGFLKTQWMKTEIGEVNDYTLYHSSELGLSWEVPQEWLHFQRSHLEMKFGYRTQTIYTEAPMGDAVDNTEGFTLGLRLVF